MICKLLTIYYNLRYIKYLAHGELLSGHQLVFTGEVYLDMWRMKCRHCGIHALSEVSPENM